MYRNRTRRLGFKMALLIVAMLIALGTMSVSYAAWMDTVSIENTVNMGMWDHSIIITGCDTDPAGGSIACNLNTDTIEINITDAQYDPEIGPVTHYYCEYSILNTGTVPIIIKSKIFNISPDYCSYNLSGDFEGEQIDAGETAAGTVDIYLTSESSIKTDIVATLAFTFAVWNN